MKFEIGAATVATGMRWFALSLMCATVAACGTTQVAKKRSHPKEYFSEKEYGVKASPRVATGNNIPKGGGRYMVGNPYQVRGKWYYPKEDFSYDKVGVASWYGSAFHGRLTANGEVYDQMHLSAAHPTFPLPSYARVTNTENGSSVIVRVNDRGPYHEGRIIDLSNKTADMLDLQHSGTGQVRVQYVGRARMDGHDMPYLMASYVPKGSRLPRINPEGQIATGVMVASNQTMGDQLRSIGYTPPQPARIPVPISATSYAGSTPSAAPRLAPAANNATQAFDQLVVLPEIGPIPYERPDYIRSGSLASAYQNEAPVKTVVVPIAFDAVMARNDGLTQASILASFKHQQAAKVQGR
ncbi:MULTISPECIES: septal ring lytic transglycosylase RlpA family protein [unclassified Sinorhizobium]|uniref:septal ring lytic transglycosylase RlpA family protein n=1 Tax=unclassified Sinorhizobium TaxID=2613772 RepID=UPI0035252ED0